MKSLAPKAGVYLAKSLAPTAWAYPVKNPAPTAETYPIKVKSRAPTAGAYLVKVASLEPRAYSVRSQAQQDPFLLKAQLRQQKSILLQWKAELRQ